MGLFNLFCKKKHEVTLKKTDDKQPKDSVSDKSPQINEDANVIMGRGLVDSKNALLFYRKQWSGKGDSGVEWIVIKHEHNYFQITFKQSYAGYSEALPQLDSIKAKEITVSVEQLVYYSYDFFLEYIQKEFGIILNGSECVTQKQYYQWIDLTNKTFLSETVIYQSPLSSCCGGIEPTDFIIKIFTNRIEIIWGVGWRGGVSHADGAGGSEMLNADYFKNNTIDDFIVFLESKSWAKDFLKWFNLKNDDKLLCLFDNK